MVWREPWGGGLGRDQIFKGSSTDILSEASWNPPPAHLHGPCKPRRSLGSGEARQIATKQRVPGPSTCPESGPQGLLQWPWPPWAWAASYPLMPSSPQYLPGAAPGSMELSIQQAHERMSLEFRSHPRCPGPRTRSRVKGCLGFGLCLQADPGLNPSCAAEDRPFHAFSARGA